MKFFFAALFFISVIYCNVFDHLKPAPNKRLGHSIKNIDFIYMINLDQRPEKFEYSCKQLNQYQIYPYRFSAVNGWELTVDQFNDIGIKYAKGMDKEYFVSYFDENLDSKHEILGVEGRTYFGHCTARGTIGIILSHLSVIKDAYDSGFETIWVMEDDIHVREDPNILSSLIDKLDDTVGYGKWDILFTDKDTKDANGKNIPCTSAAKRPNFQPSNPKKFALRKKTGKNFERVGARYGAYSMIIRRSGMKKILRYYKKYNAFLPFDMDYIMPEGMVFYCTRKEIVTTTPGAPSDNGGENYLKPNQAR